MGRIRAAIPEADEVCATPMGRAVGVSVRFFALTSGTDRNQSHAVKVRGNNLDRAIAELRAWATEKGYLTKGADDGRAKGG